MSSKRAAVVCAIYVAIPKVVNVVVVAVAVIWKNCSILIEFELKT